MVLARCEWGHDDYSLNVANLPIAARDQVEFEEEIGTEKTRGANPADPNQGGLFAGDET